MAHEHHMNETQPRPTSIRIFLVDGAPDGIRLVSKANWVGSALVASRAQLDEALRREELGKPGVYVLIGEGENNVSTIYIGEADVLKDRLRQHAGSKDFWSQFVAFASSDDSLNKANVRYLEYRLISLARAAKQWALDNQTVPVEPPLSETDRADAEWFLKEMLVIYPILGIDAFESASSEVAVRDAADALRLVQKGVDARGRETRDGFVVHKGSRGRRQEVPSLNAQTRDWRVRLLERGVLSIDGENLVFGQDFRFSSPSLAAGVLVGGSVNGRTAWKAADGRTLKQIQDQRAGSGA